MYEVQQYASNQLSAALSSQISAYFSLLMMEGATGDARFWHPFGYSYDPPMQHFVVAERGLLICHADVTRREIQHESETFRLYGIGEVMTHPAFRHEGHGRRVIDAATAYILSSDADVAMLFTAPELAAFYGLNGWVALHNHGITFGDPAQPTFDDAFVMMLFVSDKGKASRAAFERGPVHVGARMW